MFTRQSFKKFSALLIACGICTIAQADPTDISTDPLNTYSAPSSTDVKPNVLFVLDDSGSMYWDFLPDWACSDDYSTTLYLGYAGRYYSCSNWLGSSNVPASSPPEYLFRNNAYNGVAYNAATTYKAPVTFASDGTQSSYASMKGTSAATGANTSYSLPNWRAVPHDGFGVQDTYDNSGTRLPSTTDLTSNGAYYYTTVPGEYCTSASLRTCTKSSVPTGSYTYPASLRWCSDSALTTCKATFDSTYRYPRSTSPYTATITISGSSSSSASSIKVGGLEIMSASISASSTSSTVASRIRDQINACTNSIPTGSSCTTVGYSATSSGNVVTIYAPGITILTPAVTKSGTMTFTATAFAENAIGGAVLRTTITPSVTSYPYPGKATKAATRTDCAGNTCTYAEEMTNYANWWAYYHTRMQMMKSGVSQAFSSLDSASDMANNVSRFRVGYMSIDNNTGSDFLNLGEFQGSQKANWYTKLLSATPGNGTPLREALATAGRLYGGKLNGSRVNGVTVSDPLQYSCQQNYTILSTDGFWSRGDAYKLDGSTAVGNQDGSARAPYNDGASTQIQSRTSTLQSRTMSSQLQKRTGHLQERDYSRRRWSSWSNVTSCSPDSNTECQYNWGSWANVSSCTSDQSSGSGTWTIANGTDCQTATSYGTWTPVSSCTASSTRECGYTSWSSWSDVSSCTAVDQSTSSPYNVSAATQCQTLTSGGTSDTLADVAYYYYNTDLRSPTASGADATGTCTGPVNPPATTASDLCTDNVPSSGRDQKISQHMTTFTLGLGAQGAMVYAPQDGVDYWNDKSGDFYDVYKQTSASPSAGICSWQTSGQCTWPIPGTNSSGGGIYTNIDDLWHAAVNGAGSYFSAKDPDSLSSGLTATLSTIINTPRPGTAAAAASSNPNVSASDNYVFSSSYKSVEWYGELVRQQITDSGTLTAQNWSAMRLLDCATSPWTASHSYSVGDVFRHGTTCYVVKTAYPSGASFDTSATGADLSNTTVINVDETATPPTPATAQTSRTIYTKGASTTLIPFQWTNLQSAGYSSYFTAPTITYSSSTSGLSQFCSSGSSCLSSTAQSNTTIASGGAAGEALVNFLRGDRTYEGIYFRQRVHVLGDIVSSEARYVQKPMFDYADAGYSDFKTLEASRTGAVYVGSNDGMVHAFSASTGQEMWAYVPSMVLPNIYRLADMNYSTKHEFLVDGTPETGDICPSAPCAGSDWKTILVGGLNRGGMGYYALDITDPASPKLLWEFTNSSLSHATQGYLGYAYSNPRIVKLKDGTWVVLIASGYNNADGVGRLYVLNANTGSIIRTISTGVGTAASPSGLARLSAHVLESMTDNTATAAYGGDVFGNLWRFDVNGDIGATGYDAQSLVAFKDVNGDSQPITIKPLEATINGHPVVFVGTGRYLGTTDVTDTQRQSFYAVKDNLDTTTLSDPHNNSTFVQQTLTSTTCPAGSTVCNPGQVVRTSTSNAVDWTTKNGWYIDFLNGGERSVTDPALGLGTLLFTTISPQQSSVSACGASSGDASASFLYALDYMTGAPVSVATGETSGLNTVSGISLGSGLATRPVMIEQSDGTVRALVRTSGSSTTNSSGTDLGSTVVSTPPVVPPSSSGVRRVSWRELSDSN